MPSIEWNLIGRTNELQVNVRKVERSNEPRQLRKLTFGHVSLSTSPPPPPPPPPSKDSDQPAHPRSLIRILTGRILDSLRCKISYGQRSLWLNCANAQADFSLRWAIISLGTVLTLGLEYWKKFSPSHFSAKMPITSLQNYISVYWTNINYVMEEYHKRHLC